VVIGVAVQAVSLVLILGYYRQHKTLDWDVARSLREGVSPADADPFRRARAALTALLGPAPDSRQGSHDVDRGHGVGGQGDGGHSDEGPEDGSHDDRSGPQAGTALPSP
jgi:hypothetical protein